jgi:DNA-binding LytR/AlgR family response regulator
MITAVLRNNAAEATMLEKGIRNEVADRTNETVHILRIMNREMLEQFLQGKNLADIICIDVATKHGLDYAVRIRSAYPNSLILLVADVTMPPVLYMKPNIMAAALLLRPLCDEAVVQTIRQIFECFLTKEDSDVFVIENREEKVRIPYRDIIYFEAREKKIYACTSSVEYGFYDTMDQLEGKLSNQFIRCHRSYLLNRKYLKKVKLSKNCVVLMNDIELPLSRSYKGMLKDM